MPALHGTTRPGRWRRGARAAFAAFLVLASCSTRPATEVMVFVDAEPGVRAATVSLEVRVEGSTGRGAADFAERELSTLASPGWPVRVALAPLDGDGQRVYRVTATALDGATPTPALVGQVRVVSGYRPNESVRIDLMLQDACLHHAACPDDQTCVAGSCVAAMIDPATLVPLGTDAGASDGARDVDAGADGGACPATEETTLSATDGEMGDNFGRTLAIDADGTRVLVGVDGDNFSGGTGIVGSARVFSRTGTSWTQETTLSPSAPSGFGWPVALTSDGVRAIVGTAGNPQVFVRTGTTWSTEGTLTGSGTVFADHFGSAIAVDTDGTHAIVGAPMDETSPGVTAGSARLFLRAGSVWTEEATLVASDGATGDYFGGAVALSADGSRAIVGAYTDDTTAGIDAGSAHVFLRTGTTWAEEAILVASDGARSDALGGSVALSADASRAIVGVQQDSTVVGTQAGSARIFVRTGTTWTEEATLLAATGAAHDQFGGASAISADGALALVGGFAGERARLFVRRGAAWSEALTLSAIAGAPGDGFGRAVALSADGTHALVGAPGAGPTTAGNALVATVCAP